MHLFLPKAIPAKASKGGVSHSKKQVGSVASSLACQKAHRAGLQLGSPPCQMFGVCVPSICLRLCFPLVGFKRNMSLLGICFFPGVLTKWSFNTGHATFREASRKHEKASGTLWNQALPWMVAKSASHHPRNPRMIRFPNVDTNVWYQP